MLGPVGGEVEMGVAFDGATDELVTYSNNTGDPLQLDDSPNQMGANAGANFNLGYSTSSANLTSPTVNISWDIGDVSVSVKLDAATMTPTGIEIGGGFAGGSSVSTTSGREHSRTCINPEGC